MHVRQKIRDAFIGRVTGLDTTADRVFRMRGHAIEAADYPCLQVFTGNEDVEVEAKGKPSAGEGPALRRTLDMMVLVRVKADEDLFQDRVDDIAAEVEVAVAEDPTLDGLALDTRLANSAPVTDADGSIVAGALVMTFRIRYRTAAGQPSMEV